MSALADLYVILSLRNAPFTAGLDESAAAGEAFTAKMTAGLTEATTAAADMSGEVTAAADAAAAAQAKIAESAAAAGDAEKGLADMERLEAEMASTAADSARLLADAQMASVDATLASARAQGLLKDAEIASGDAAVTQAGKADASAGSLAALGAKGKMAFLGVAAGAAYAVVKAASFQTEVTRLYTAAGLTGQNMTKVEQAILKVGDATGFTGTQIAEAMYHPISAGLSLRASLAAVSEGAKLAQIHGANLDDTMYALSSIMKSFSVGAGGAAKTASLLNAIVGQGDMRFQDFNQSVKNWAPTAASMGISVQSMGAALAYLTDRGNSAETASTRLTMGLSMVTAGSKEANTFLSALGLTSGSVALKNKTLADVMNSYGLTTNKIAADLKQPDGIYVALKQIQGAFHASGLSAAQADQVMAKIFGGGRSDKAILSLMSNLDNLKSKYNSIGKSVGDYGNSWAKTQETVTVQWHKALASIQNLAISFGSMLLPAVQKVLGALGKFFGYLQQHPLLAKVAGGILAVVAAAGLLEGVMAGLGAIMDAAVPVLIIAAIAAVAYGLYELYQHSKLVRDIVADVGHFFASAWQAAMRAAGAVISWFTKGPLAFLKQEIGVVSAWWRQHSQEISEVTRVVWSAIRDVITVDLAIVKAYVRVVLTGIESAWRLGWGIIRDTVVTMWHLIANEIRMAVTLITGIIGIGLDLITGHWSKAWHDLLSLASTLMGEIKHTILQFVSDFGTLLFDAGKNLIEGLVNGVKSMLGAVGSVMGSIGHTALGAIKSVLGISSPSKVMHDIGLEIGRGLVQGLEGSKSSVKSAASKLAAYVREAFNAGDISQGTASSLTSFIQRDNSRLQHLANDRAAILKQIAAAKKYATTTAQAEEQQFGVVNAAGGGTAPATAASILATLKTNLTQIKQFKANIAKLAKMGLNKAYINQIIQAGPVDGGQIAAELASGSWSQIQQINSVEKQISSASTSLGKTAADAMYDSGKQAGKGFLSGLEAQQKSIEEMMKRIAKAMVRTIRRELGISSPSTVMRQHGRDAARGFALGIEDGIAGTTAASSRLAGALSAGAHGGGAGGGGTVIHLEPHITVQGYIGSEEQLVGKLLPPLQKLVLEVDRINPGTGNGLSLGSAAGRAA